MFDLDPDLEFVLFIDEHFDRSLPSFRATAGLSKPTFVLESDRLRPLRANYLDLRSAPPDADGPIHFPIDSHIDARGHRWVADQLRKAPVAATSAGPARPRR